MNNQMISVRQRRDELLARIATQRVQVAKAAVHWERPLAFVDQGLAAVRFFRSNPLILAGVAALLVIRRRGVVGLGVAAWKGWKLYHLAKSFASNLSNRA